MGLSFSAYGCAYRRAPAQLLWPIREIKDLKDLVPHGWPGSGQSWCEWPTLPLKFLRLDFLSEDATVPFDVRPRSLPDIDEPFSTKARAAQSTKKRSR